MKDAATKPDRVTGLERDVEPAFPLKALLPLNVSYRVGLEAAERGVLRAYKNGGRGGFVPSRRWRVGSR